MSTPYRVRFSVDPRAGVRDSPVRVTAMVTVDEGRPPLHTLRCLPVAATAGHA